jgi:ribosomal protein S18 acetylase RimI-like enzyme
MAQGAMSVDVENTDGALQLYRSMGFGVVKRPRIAPLL